MLATDTHTHTHTSYYRIVVYVEWWNKSRVG